MRSSRWLWAFLLLFAAVSAQAEDRPLLKRPEKRLDSIGAVNVERPMGIVMGTVTVRLDGVVADAQQIGYNFMPAFPNSQGRMRKAAPGVYTLKLRNVPSDEFYTLTVSASHNDTVVKDGVVVRYGRTRTGNIQIQIPHGRESYSFGDQILDLR